MKCDQSLFSIVIPVYNEEDSIPEMHRRLDALFANLRGQMEMVFVDDGSKDGSVGIMRGLQKCDQRVKLIKLSRNFGHQAAVTAGLEHARGDAVIIIDADLQDPPEVIPELIQKWREGYEVVYAVRRRRDGETLFKRASAKVFYRTMKKLTNVSIPVDTGDFRLIGRKALDTLLSMREHHRFIRGMVSWIGYPQTGVLYARDRRYGGVSKYPLAKMIKFGIDGITSFSWIPLRLATHAGIVSAILSIILAAWVVYSTVVTHKTVPGWASTMIAILFLGGTQLFALGLIGEYIGRIYDEVRGRPLYIIEESDCDTVN